VPARSLRLDPHTDKIDEYLAKGIDKRSVAKLLVSFEPSRERRQAA
jgi:hypothetical protein